MATRKDKARKPESSPKDNNTPEGGGHDESIVALVRLLARKAAKRDYEELLKKLETDQPTGES